MARFISDDPLKMMMIQRYSTAFNLDGIWGGNMRAARGRSEQGSPQHSIRYLPTCTNLKKIAPSSIERV